METSVIMGTGENLGKFTVNIDQGQMLNDMRNNLRKIFGADGMRKKTLLLVVVVIGFLLIKLWMRKLDDKRRHKKWEDQEREKANIWKEEYKN